jgi:hypothetical protein
MTDVVSDLDGDACRERFCNKGQVGDEARGLVLGDDEVDEHDIV